MSAISLAFTADIIPTRRLDAVSGTSAPVYRLLRDADLTIGNFEIPLVETGAPLEKLMTIRAEPAIAADVPELGIDVVTIANNHAVDYGAEGLLATKARLEAAGLAVIGAGRSLDEATAPVVRRAGGRRIGVIAFSCLTPTGVTADGDRAGLAPIRIQTAYEIDPWYQMEEPGDPAVVRIRTRPREEDLAFALRKVAEARAGCDVLVVTIHWGFGSGDALAEYQWPLGRALIDAGADVVHGHHPHAVHPVAFHRGRPVLFGLGTFIGQQVLLPASDAARAMWATMSPDGLVATVEIDGDAMNVAVVPTTLDADRLPRLCEPDRFRSVADRLERLSAPFGTVVETERDRLILRPGRHRQQADV